jgi:hypothetical protein
MELVGAMGIKPARGEIFDYFLEGGLIGLRRAFHRQSFEYTRYWGKEWTPEEADLVEQHREMTCRIAWKPYMHSLTLRHLLPSARTSSAGGRRTVLPRQSSRSAREQRRDEDRQTGLRRVRVAGCTQP